MRGFTCWFFSFRENWEEQKEPEFKSSKSPTPIKKEEIEGEEEEEHCLDKNMNNILIDRYNLAKNYSLISDILNQRRQKSEWRQTWKVHITRYILHSKDFSILDK